MLLKKLHIFLLAIFLAAVSSAFGQIVGGTISGAVRDKTGAAVAGATVTVRQIETCASRHVNHGKADSIRGKTAVLNCLCLYKRALRFIRRALSVLFGYNALQGKIVRSIEPIRRGPENLYRRFFPDALHRRRR